MNAIKDKLHLLRFLWCSIPIAYKLATGRWYVFRDAPDWLVFEWAALSEVALDDGPARNGVRQATEEATRRLNRRMDAAIAQLIALCETALPEKADENHA
jgi:hypothetical protein